MPSTIYVCKGLPGSGKSTWAREFLLENNLKGKLITRVNRDDLRAMCHEGKWSKEKEKLIVDIENSIIIYAIHARHDVIVDDTNLAPGNIERITGIAKMTGSKIEIEDFTDVPVNECIRRDKERPNPVGSEVILRMYNQFLKKDFEKEKVIMNQDPNLPHCVIVDVDGTLAIRGDRGPFDWHRVGEDTVNPMVKNFVNVYYGHNGLSDGSTSCVFVFSGRDGICYDQTSEWLHKNYIYFDDLFMRTQGDNRKDCIIKRELFDEHIAGKYYVDLVLDDRQQVVDMWREMGLTCWQVAEGNF